MYTYPPTDDGYLLWANAQHAAIRGTPGATFITPCDGVEHIAPQAVVAIPTACDAVLDGETTTDVDAPLATGGARRPCRDYGAIARVADGSPPGRKRVPVSYACYFGMTVRVRNGDAI
jgi:hypothetical protein